MDGCNHSVKKVTRYYRMDKTDPPGEASKVKKMNDRSLFLLLIKLHINLKNRQLPSGILRKNQLSLQKFYASNRSS